MGENRLVTYMGESRLVAYMGESSKFPKSWTFETAFLKTCFKPTKYSQFQVEMVNCPKTNLKIISEAIMISLIQHFEADFLWKVSLKILNSGINLKTFTNDNIKIWHVAIWSIILFKEWVNNKGSDQNEWMRRRLCAYFVSI